ncbi:MAG: hypothetical protein AB1585_10820 [Thermodesulfobacteriota bacterium]
MKKNPLFATGLSKTGFLFFQSFEIVVIYPLIGYNTRKKFRWIFEDNRWKKMMEERINREIFEVTQMNIVKSVHKCKINEQPSDFSFWQSKSYQERIAALEEIRQEYNQWKYHADQRLQRVYRIIKQTQR